MAKKIKLKHFLKSVAEKRKKKFFLNVSSVHWDFIQGIKIPLFTELID